MHGLVSRSGWSTTLPPRHGDLAGVSITSLRVTVVQVGMTKMDDGRLRARVAQAMTSLHGASCAGNVHHCSSLSLSLSLSKTDDHRVNVPSLYMYFSVSLSPRRSKEFFSRHFLAPNFRFPGVIDIKLVHLIDHFDESFRTVPSKPLNDLNFVKYNSFMIFNLLKDLFSWIGAWLRASAGQPSPSLLCNAVLSLNDTHFGHMKEQQ